jgi:hypothetical protein
MGARNVPQPPPAWIEEGRTLRSQGWSWRRLSIRYGVSHQTIVYHLKPGGRDRAIQWKADNAERVRQINKLSRIRQMALREAAETGEPEDVVLKRWDCQWKIKRRK